MTKRKGQQTFKRRSTKAHGQNKVACEATLCSIYSLCDACHIKPYSICEESEKLDPNNSILLLSSIHRAFDQGFITFNLEGKIIISEELSEWEWSCLGLSGSERIRMPGKRPFYMEYHRENIFKDNLL